MKVVRPYHPSRAAFFVTLVSVLFGLLGAGVFAAPPRPNIVLLMADDQGWGETGYNGHPYLQTPVLDEMARTGLRFDRVYSASPVCSPTFVRKPVSFFP